MPKRTRRSAKEILEATLALARKGPLTSAELAKDAGFSPHRARQVLEGLVRSRKLRKLGKRSSGRGKPAVLYGLPETVVTEADLAPRIKKRGKPQVEPRRGVATSKGAGAQMGDLALLFGLIETYARGVAVRLASGQELEIRPLGSARAPAARKRRAPAKKAATKAPAREVTEKEPARRKAAKKAAPRRKKSTSKPEASVAAARKKPAPKPKARPSKKVRTKAKAPGKRPIKAPKAKESEARPLEIETILPPAPPI